MTTVIGIDPSYSCTGVAVWVDGDVRTFSVRTSPTLPRVQRQHAIASDVVACLDPTEPTVCVIEGVYQSGFGRVSLDLAGLHDVLVYEFVRYGARVGVVAAKSAKLFATGDGAADKKAMLLAAKLLLGRQVSNHNEADALWFMTMGVYWMGHAQPLNMDVRNDAVSKIKWIIPRGEFTWK